jgi:AcrR family transcriptional regulator
MTAREKASVERRQQILAAAMTCFMRKGYHQATMDDIVVESGLSKGTLYWYFKSKKELFLALVQSIMQQIEFGWQAAIDDSTKSATEKLLLITALFRVELGEMAPFFGIMMEAWALTRHDPDVEELVKGMYTPYLDIMSQIIAEGVANGEFEADSAEATALVIMILYDGLTLAKALEILDMDWDRLLDATESLLFRGLGMGNGRES